ncbi:hypothetical protein F383_10423 [Gossypium arboreum]|uniref:Uncharacterized protein n=1 Tax=Gossypium arboreum TaxID=29729 RepID=A0A0B0P4M0_GOSAR|nr:hypothetical protein F383_10423 [Gossypium arboreum]
MIEPSEEYVCIMDLDWKGNPIWGLNLTWTGNLDPSSLRPGLVIPP